MPLITRLGKLQQARYSENLTIQGRAESHGFSTRFVVNQECTLCRPALLIQYENCQFKLLLMYAEASGGCCSSGASQRYCPYGPGDAPSRVSPFGNVVSQLLGLRPSRQTVSRHPSRVCICRFQSPALRKHAGVSLVLRHNVVRSRELSLVRQGIQQKTECPSPSGDWVPYCPHGQATPLDTCQPALPCHSAPDRPACRSSATASST